MTNKEFNTRLYEKCFKEQEAYIKELLKMSTRELLDHAYAYAVREDILLSLTYNNFTDEQCAALSHIDNPLETIMNNWSEEETPYMEWVADSIENTANICIHIQEFN